MNGNLHVQILLRSAGSRVRQSTYPDNVAINFEYTRDCCCAVSTAMWTASKVRPRQECGPTAQLRQRYENSDMRYDNSTMRLSGSWTTGQASGSVSTWGMPWTEARRRRGQTSRTARAARVFERNTDFRYDTLRPPLTHTRRDPDGFGHLRARLQRLFDAAGNYIRNPHISDGPLVYANGTKTAHVGV